MPHARLMTRTADYPRLGIEPGTVQPWEVGRREEPLAGRSELWHFEASMADGTTTAVAFCLVGPGPSSSDSVATVVNVFLTLPDGSRFQRTVPGSDELAAVGTTRCELPLGPHAASGDLTTFRVTVDPVDGVGVDLTYDALVSSYRPGGTATIELSGDGDGDGDLHYAVHAVPRCAVAGTVTADGRTWEVTGQGYQDHQWTDADLQGSWHHWVWGRFYSERVTVVLYDMVTSEQFGFTRIPILGVLDETGEVVLDNRAGVASEVTTVRDPASGKDYPQRSRYVVRDGARTVELDFERTDELVAVDVYGASDAPSELGGGQREQFDAMGIAPSYARYRATGTVTITDGTEVVTEDGEMIYELNHVGRPDDRAPIG